MHIHLIAFESSSFDAQSPSRIWMNFNLNLIGPDTRHSDSFRMQRHNRWWKKKWNILGSICRCNHNGLLAAMFIASKQRKFTTVEEQLKRCKQNERHLTHSTLFQTNISSSSTPLHWTAINDILNTHRNKCRCESIGASRLDWNGKGQSCANIVPKSFGCRTDQWNQYSTTDDDLLAAG